ncbi:MAG TPA: DNA mismatch repair endonuclease MutL [Candidatus Methanoculleus thermohydrogenotrophicum]|nr:DNA mismatch repair endonuclease MutL [Candidatus Methanoculleus thermohydrogenotrophicum]NLM82438.1 DNA mismatch repair endonuclease MutL [Candidatus Methanoculleus thermohydrogenotrophicum]HOB18498.1 DNA mismatch repair endonuclease MutL [Candidatus Methanoculleus thermohydrogenotrophicum]HPZ38599.1 DNA mismatch repair endonuclease MutL [Candidatus Methanoculleus thermohydrogenotrophicum]HQC91744.1 DNA mismatch repair endonuclease MutL [Candidatus Methanoculleus thermohydrogenotrophicum]
MTGTKIRILDPDTVNQIAAGEVVERPASVVKELLENAIDAGAMSILVEVSSDLAGVTKIRVTDDGEGMTPEEAVLAFQPHATSKIRDIADLSFIRTLGFRGEALASIAAVAEVTLVTRPRDSGALAGTRVVVRGGEVVEKNEVGAPEGTTVIVEHLFYNTPARRKFLKSRNTELAHIYGVAESLALAHGEVAFRVVHNGRERMATQRSGGLLNTIAGLYGADLARALIPIEARTPLLRISGYISRPSENRGNPSGISISINGRSITARQITAAVREGYGTLLPKGRYPVAFLDLSLEAGLVDVNVHPTKREVRLSREQEILSVVAAAVEEALRRHELAHEAPAEPVQQQIVPAVLEPEKPEGGSMVAQPEVSYAAGHREFTLSDRQLRRTEGSRGAENLLPAMEPVGQVAATYIVAEGTDGTLYLIDQHAAHERILYDQVVEQRDAKPRSQELIVPAILSFPPRESAALRDLIPVLAEEGFMVEEFGRDTFAVRAVPVALGTLEDLEVIRETVADLLTDASRTNPDQREAVTCIVACRGAVKAGVLLTHEQQKRLLAQLARTKTPWTCPHGRPTVVAFDKRKLDRMFWRA